MDRRSLYDDDIYAWAQEQAAALRRLAETRRDLPNELDLGIPGVAALGVTLSDDH